MGGGSAANTACWLASLGTAVSPGGRGGRRRARPGRARPRSTSSVCVFAGQVDAEAPPPGSCVVLIDGAGERTMLPDRGANDDAVPRRRWTRRSTRDVAWVHLSGYALLGDGSAPGRAGRHGRRPAARPPVVGRRRQRRARCAPPARTGSCAGSRVAPCCSPTTTSSRALGGAAPRSRCAGEVVVKLGPAGASWTDGTRSESSPAAPATVVDTIGAGDAFDAGFLAARLGGADPGRVAPRGHPRRRPGGEPARCPPVGPVGSAHDRGVGDGHLAAGGGGADGAASRGRRVRRLVRRRQPEPGRRLLRGAGPGGGRHRADPARHRRHQPVHAPPGRHGVGHRQRARGVRWARRARHRARRLRPRPPRSGAGPGRRSSSGTSPRCRRTSAARRWPSTTSAPRSWRMSARSGLAGGPTSSRLHWLPPRPPEGADDGRRHRAEGDRRRRPHRRSSDLRPRRRPGAGGVGRRPRPSGAPGRADGRVRQRGVPRRRRHGSGAGQRRHVHLRPVQRDARHDPRTDGRRRPGPAPGRARRLRHAGPHPGRLTAGRAAHPRVRRRLRGARTARALHRPAAGSSPTSASTTS